MMRPLSLAEIAEALRVPAPPGDLRVSGVSTDSRALVAGELFVALAGERFDGHDHTAEAVARGAIALVCSRAVDAAVPVLYVDNTLIALGRIAQLHRALFRAPLVALTGSAGKTTTKDMTAAILAQAGTVHATRGNLNNEIGVPLTLFGLHPAADYAVIEMGAGQPGDIAYLAGIARPDVALVTNALPAHLERLGTLEEVARTKGAIYDALPADGVAVLNIDDAFASQWAARIGSRRTVRASARGAREAEVQARDIGLDAGCARFTLVLPGTGIDIALRVPGVQQVANAVAAAGVACALGIDAACIRAGLQSLQPAAGRMRPRAAAGGALVIDDTYNANPGSVRAAIDTLASFPGTRVLVLGNMAELGESSGELHEGIGAYARERGIECLLATGVHAGRVARAFGAGARAFETRDALARACGEFDLPGFTLLVKGSRSAGMEAVVATLVDAEPGIARAEAP